MTQRLTVAAKIGKQSGEIGAKESSQDERKLSFAPISPPWLLDFAPNVSLWVSEDGVAVVQTSSIIVVIAQASFLQFLLVFVQTCLTIVAEPYMYV